MNSIATEQISTLKMSIYRYDPDTGNKPFMQELDIDIPSDKDIMVLDALHLAKERIHRYHLDVPVGKVFVVQMA